MKRYFDILALLIVSETGLILGQNNVEWWWGILVWFPVYFVGLRLINLYADDRAERKGKKYLNEFVGRRF